MWQWDPIRDWLSAQISAYWTTPLLTAVQIAMVADLPYSRLRDAVLAHPTMAEGLGALFATVREVGQEPSGVLRVALPVGLPPQIIAGIFGALRVAYPRLHVETRFSDDPLAESLAWEAALELERE